MKIQNVYSPQIRDWEDSVFFYIALACLNLISLLDSCTMCIPLTPVLYIFTTIINEVYSAFTESVSQRAVSKPTSRTEISSPNLFPLKAVKNNPLWVYLTWYLKLKINITTKNNAKLHSVFKIEKQQKNTAKPACYSHQVKRKNLKSCFFSRKRKTYNFFPSKENKTSEKN